MSTSIRESFSAEQTEHALGPDPFSPRRLRLLRALADAILSEAPANPAARQENDELVASFAELFFPALPEEQARSQLALLVTPSKSTITASRATSPGETASSPRLHTRADLQVSRSFPRLGAHGIERKLNCFFGELYGLLSA